LSREKGERGWGLIFAWVSSLLLMILKEFFEEENGCVRVPDFAE
jgi:hypothetical protein